MTAGLGGRGPAGLSDIALLGSSEHEVRFTSGKTIYLEGLVGSRWVGRFWSANGCINLPYDRWASDAFELIIDGQSLATEWKWVAAKETDPGAHGERHLVVELRSDLRPVNLQIHTLLDSTPVLTRWLEIVSTGDRPAALSVVSPWVSRLWDMAGVSRDRDIFSLGYFSGVHQGWEGWLEWIPLGNVTTRLEDRRGQGFNHPFFIVRNEARGEYFVGHLAWSANWAIEFRSDQDQGDDRAVLQFKAGPTAIPPQRVIAPGETVTTPAVHLGHVEGDLDEAIQGMHQHIRRSVLPSRAPERSQLVQYAVGSDVGFTAARFGDDKSICEETILQHVDIAATLGMELFILDAGWWDMPGEWVPSPTRFPRGLKPIADHVHSKGMLFGLYCEIERILTWNTGDRGLACRLANEHPDWIGPAGILDFTVPEVAACAESELTRIIEGYDLDLYRLDFNPFGFEDEGPRTARDGYLESNYWRYYEAFYGIFERLRARYPDLILQQCAAGGGRNDLGVIGRFHEAYLTDGLSVPHVLRNYCGQSMALPPEIFVIGLGVEPTTRGLGHVDTQLRCTFTLSTPWLHSGVAPSLDELTADRKARYLHYVDLYKSFIRPVLPTAKVYHHAPATATQGVAAGGWFAIEFAAPDGLRGWATVVRIGANGADSFILRPRGLDPGRDYQVTFDSAGSTAPIPGWRLVREGIEVRREALLSSELLLFEVR